MSCAYSFVARGNLLNPFFATTIKTILNHYKRCVEESATSRHFDTRGLLLRRPIRAMTPFFFIGKEVERRAQEGEDVSALENNGPVKYHRHQTAKTRAADAGLVLRARCHPLRQLMRESGASQHAIERFLDGDRVHPATRAMLAQSAGRLDLEKEGLHAP